MLFASTFNSTTSMSYYVTGPDSPYDVTLNFTNDVTLNKVTATSELVFSMVWGSNVQLFGDGYEVRNVRGLL